MSHEKGVSRGGSVLREGSVSRVEEREIRHAINSFTYGVPSSTYKQRVSGVGLRGWEEVRQ